jgi:hypothetical protein
VGAVFVCGADAVGGEPRVWADESKLCVCFVAGAAVFEGGVISAGAGEAATRGFDTGACTDPDDS